MEELGEEKCYYHGKTDVSNEVCIKERSIITYWYNFIQSDVDLAIAKTLEHFPQYPLAGAILCSGILKAPNHVSGYGPDNVLTSYRQFEHIIKVNLLGTYCVAQKVSEVLLKNEPMNQDGERGIIITVSSILGLDGTLVSYGTSKGKRVLYYINLIYHLVIVSLAGIAGLTLPLARELASFGIRIMSIAPGPFGKTYHNHT